MKRRGRPVGLFFGSGTVALLSWGAVGVTPALAASHHSAATPGTTGHGVPSTVSAVGIYNYTDGGMITEGGTWYATVPRHAR
jgi:predicted sugar kinase